MLFRKKIARFCAYCSHAGIVDGERMLCKKKGFVPCNSNCSFFRYDPLKRTPPKLAVKDFSAFDDSDFSL